MRVRAPILVVLVAAVVAVVFAGCGSSSKKGALIPRADSAAIVLRLQEAKRRSSPLRCRDLQQDTIPTLERQVANLPPGTDQAIVQTLNDGISHLKDLVDQECAQRQQTTPTTPPTTQSTPSTTQSTPSTTQSTPSTDTNTTNTNTTPSTSTNTTPSTGTTGGGTPAPPGSVTPPSTQPKKKPQPQGGGQGTHP